MNLESAVYTDEYVSKLVATLFICTKKSGIYPQVRRGINSPSHSESRLKTDWKPQLNYHQSQSSLRGLSL
jgi:hypothetical protein